MRGMLSFTSPSPGFVKLTPSLLVENRPTGPAAALGYIRRLAVAVLDLADEAAKSAVPSRPPP